jgi:hypothetical protein
VEIEMNLLTRAEIKKLSFSDYVVEDMRFDIFNRVMKITTNGGFLSVNGGVKLKSCHMIVKDWQLLNARLYRTKTKKWEKLDTSDLESLIDICEFCYGEEIIFRGFGVKTGQWIELIFSKASLQVECQQ